MNSTCKFAKYFYKHLNEDNGAGAGSAFGDGPSTHDISKYADGDARVPYIIGKKKGVQRRTFPGPAVESEEDTHPGYEDTTWSDGEVTITMQDVEDKLTELESPVISIPVEDIAHLDIHTRHKPNKTPEQVKSTYDRAMKADLKYPIIITKNSGRYDMILDGNHRLHKAVEQGDNNIQARVLDLSKVPEEWVSVFG